MTQTTISRTWILLALLALGLGACQGASLPSTSSPSATPFSSPLAPPTVSVFESPIDMATESPSSTPQGGEPVIAVSAPDRSTITGVLMLGLTSRTPVSGTLLYLGGIHVDDSGNALAASLDRQTAPKAQTDANGRFVFTDVEPQQYVLILDRVSESFMLNDPQGQGDMILDPQAGQVLDLGDLVYDSLPGS